MINESMNAITNNHLITTAEIYWR